MAIVLFLIRIVADIPWIEIIEIVVFLGLINKQERHATRAVNLTR